MTVPRSVIRAFLLGRRPRAIGCAIALAVAFLAPALARSHVPAFARTHPNNDNLSAAERYAWAQIRQGLRADFNFSELCDDLLDPKQEDDPGWRDEPKSECRTVRATFIVDILTKPSFRDAMTHKGVDIRGAKIVGDVDLTFARIDRPVQISQSRFEGDILLRYAQAESVITLDGSVVSGRLDATGLHSEGELSLFRVTISDAGIALNRATIAGLVNMTGLSSAGDLDANNIQLGNSLFLRSDHENKARFKKVDLTGAKVEKTLTMDGATFDGDLSLNDVEVGKSLFMRSYGEHEAIFKTVDLRGAIVSNEIDMSGAHFSGDLDARSLHVGGPLFMDTFPEQKNKFGRMNRTRFKRVNLRNARITGQVDLSGSSFGGNLDASFMQVGGSLLMRSIGKAKATFQTVKLSGANVAGQTDMTGAIFNGDFDAESLHVGEALLMKSDGQNKTTFRKVILRGAKVSAQIDVSGASFHGDLDAEALRSEGSLLMRSEGMNKASFNNVVLRYAKISGQIDMTGASIDALDADDLQVGGTLLMASDDKNKNKASFKRMSLNSASVAGRMSMDGALLQDELVAQGLRVGGDLSMRNIYSDRPIGLSFAQLGGNLDFGGADLASLDLHGASIVGEMRLGDQDQNSTVGWAPKERTKLDDKANSKDKANSNNGALSKDGAESDDGATSINLRGAHIGSLSDNKDSWPRGLSLEGFTFARLGGDSDGELTKRGGVDWWDRNFARRNDSGTSPYEQLAAALAAVGERDAADVIRYDEQVRADEHVGHWLHQGWRWLLRWGAGYGIGSYMFRALYCALVFSLVGAAYLKFRVKGVALGNHGFWWCFGASLNQFLPGVTLKQEFKDFFDKPKLNEFTPGQDFFFVALAALGWVLGAIVIAAFATITRGS